MKAQPQKLALVAVFLGIADLAVIDLALAPELFAPPPSPAPEVVVEVEEPLKAIAVEEVAIEPERKFEARSWRLYFGTGSDRIERIDVVEEVALLAKTHPNEPIEIIGGADPRGAELGNQQLSEQRARVVGDKLVELGVASGRMTLRGVGEVSGRLREARRVEIVLGRNP